MIDDHAPKNHGWLRLTNSSKEEGAICDPLRIRTNQVVLQFQTLEGEATYFLFSTTVVFGRRWAVPPVTKRPVIADRGLPPEDPFFLANQPPPLSVSRIRLIMGRIAEFLASCMTQRYNLCMTKTRRPKSPMDFEALALFTADHAAVESNKVYVNGGFWDTLGLHNFPAQVAMSLVAVIKVPSRAFLEDHKVLVELVDADEERLPLKIEGNIRMGPTPHMNPGEPATLPLAFPLNGVYLERPGDYWFVLSVDGDEIARYRIRAVHAVPMPKLPFDAPDGEDVEEE
jgi:hypothetical protein